MSALGQVPIAAIAPDRFRELLGEGYAQVEEATRTAQRLLAGRVIWHVNSTAAGGGVAEMLHSLLAYARGAGVDVRWLTVQGNPEFFRLTKRIHNHLHDAPGDGGELDPADHRAYERTLLEAANELTGLVRKGDIVYVHDPQPAGVIPHVQAYDLRVVWRCHVGVDRPGPLARGAWEFMRRYIEGADAYVFSRREFVWDGLGAGRVWIVPPSIDAFSPKNQDLAPEAVRAILATTGIAPEDHFKQALYSRQDGSQARVDRTAEVDQDAPVPRGTPLVAQVSRWDRLKDPIGVLRCFAEHLESSDAHLLLAGPEVGGVADDPEAREVLGEVRRARERLPDEPRARVHLASLPMEDVEENAAIVNAIQRRADVVVQKSVAEGFGLTVAEAMWKAKPVVASRVGGIQDQIEDGESGLLIADPTDLKATAAAIDDLLANPERAKAMGDAARERVTRDFLGTRHLTKYMSLIEEMLTGGD